METAVKKQKISVMGAAFLGIGAMVGAGIFALLGEAGVVAGSAVWLSFLIAGIIALFQGYSFAKLGTKFPSRGGTIEFLVQSFGNGHITGVVSWLLYMAALIVGAMVAVAFGSYASQLFFGANASPQVAKLLSVIIVGIMAWLNLESGAAVAKVQKLIVWVVIAILGGFAFITIRNADFTLLAPSGYPPATDIISSVALTFFAFLGFSVVAFAAGDMENPKKELPKAMYLSLGVTTLLYVAIAIGVFGMLPLEQVIASGDTAIAEAAKPILGNAGFVIMTIAACFSTSSAVNSQFFGATNLTGYLAQIGQFPKQFGDRVASEGTMGTVISALIIALFALFLDLSSIASIGSCVALIIFMMVGIGHLRITKKTGANRPLLYIGILSVLVTLVLYSYTTLLGQPETLRLLAILLVGAVLVDRFWRSVPLLRK
ncbi:MAG TPA: APC family permease [Candidatus Saccharimonadales bacterium]|nr:APC family permease [Candidatus Saccharimonadales bacterium]